MPPDPLATFIQVSDLHFGDVDPARNDGTYDADAPRYWMHFKLCEGLLGHTVQAMKHLEELVADLRGEKDETPPHLLITGDLTCVGKGSQFKMAAEFLGARVPFPSGDDCGLVDPGWKDRCITGNHDRWNGRLPILRSGTSRACLATFPPGTFPAMAPDVYVTLSSGRDLRVRLARVDSDADLATHRLAWRRIMARGKFASQLASPAIDMGARPPDEIRLLLIHHSPTYPSTSPSLRMHSSCRTELERYLVEQGISVVMTGHIHIPRIKPFLARHPTSGDQRKVLEVRSGTATQRDAIPAHWRASLPQANRWRLPRNVVLVHRLLEAVDEGGLPAVDWETTLYWRDRAGFVPLSKAGSQLRYRVWP